MLKFRQGDVSRRQTNQDVPAAQADLMIAKPFPQHTFRAIAVYRAGEDPLGNYKT
jgi:hypothetical protein